MGWCWGGLEVVGGVGWCVAGMGMVLGWFGGNLCELSNTRTMLR